MKIVAAFALLLALAAPATAEIVMVNGTLNGDPMPDGYKYELSVVAVYQDNTINFEVVGKSCTMLASDDRSCQRTTIKFAPPAGTMTIQNKKAFYKHGDKQIYIGDVAGLGNTRWVNLRRGAVLVTGAEGLRLGPPGTNDWRLCVTREELDRALCSHRLHRVAIRGERVRVGATLRHWAIHLEPADDLSISYAALYRKELLS